MASSLSLGIHIGASMDASVGSAFANASRQAQQLSDRLNRIRVGRAAAASVQALSTELQQLQARQAAAGGSDAVLAAEISRVEHELNDARLAAQRLGLELTDLNGETNRLTQSEARLQRQLQRQQQRDTNRNRRSELMGETMGVLALGAALALPIKSAMEFEAKMSELGAVTNESTAAMEKQARQLGRDTSFDAKGAADAQIALAKAGLDNQKIQAATPVVLSIAAASMMSLGQTAEITADIMGGYSLKMNEIGKVSDVLVKTANLSTTSVAELGESLKYVGGVASAVNVSFEQSNAMLGVLSNVGIKGSQAGTSMRMAFLRLASSPKKAKEALKELGVVVKDANGNFRDMPTILKELDQSMAKMGNGEKIGNYGAIFGAESATAMLALGKAANNGELDAFTEKLKNSGGAAKEMADKMQNNAKGAMERMMSSFSELGLTIGTVLLPTVTQAADGLGAFINDVSVAGEKFPLVTEFIVKGAGALLVFKVASIAARFGMTLLSDAVIFGKAVFDFFRISTMQANIAIVRHRAAMLGVAIQSRAMAAGTAIATAAQWLFNAAITANPLGLLIIGIAAVAVAVIKYWQPIKAFADGMWDGLKIGLAPILEALAPLQPIFSAIGSAIGALFGWLSQLFTPLQSTQAELAAAGSAGQQFGIILGTAITALVSVVGTLASAFMTIGTAIGQAVAIGVGYFSQLHAAAVGMVSGFFSIGSQIMDGLLGGLNAGFAKVKATVSGMASSISGSFKSVLGIHSPSRVFVDFGKFINQGLQIGLDRSQNLPINSTKSIADVITKGFKVDTSSLGDAVAGESRKAAHAMEFFQKQGWTKNQAAGLAANLQEESKFKANAVGDGGKAYGIGQWHPDRQAVFAKQFGHSIKGSSLDEQLQFVQFELTHNEKRAGDKLKKSNSATEAGAVVSKFYERPAARSEAAANRGAMASKMAGDAVNVAASPRSESQPPRERAVESAAPMTISITINQLAGENAEDLANRVIAIIQQQQQIKNRGRLHD